MIVNLIFVVFVTSVQVVFQNVIIVLKCYVANHDSNAKNVKIYFVMIVLKCYVANHDSNPKNVKIYFIMIMNLIFVISVISV